MCCPPSAAKCTACAAAAARATGARWVRPCTRCSTAPAACAWAASRGACGAATCSWCPRGCLSRHSATPTRPRSTCSASATHPSSRRCTSTARRSTPTDSSSTPNARRLPLKRLLTAFALATLVPVVLAQGGSDFPAKPVTIVTPFAAGSGPDAVLRLVSDKLGKLWNQRVTVDNKPGGGGFIASDAARRAAPDGYTLLQLDSEHLGALPHLYKSRNFVPLQHFEPVASLFRTPFFVAVPTDSKWKSMGDLIAAAKEKPGQVSYGSWGVG